MLRCNSKKAFVVNIVIPLWSGWGFISPSLPEEKIAIECATTRVGELAALLPAWLMFSTGLYIKGLTCVNLDLG